MKPINFEKSTGNVGGIPVSHSHGIYLSRWSVSWRERVSIMIHGHVWLMVKGDNHPSVLLSGDQSFTVANRPDDM